MTITYIMNICRWLFIFVPFVRSYSIRMIPSMKLSKKIIIQQKLNQVYLPKNENQKLYVDALQDYSKKMIISVGSAGTGKTMFATLNAIELYNTFMIDKIIITRPIAAVDDEEIGFLPGDMNEKMSPWVTPILDIFLEKHSKSEIDNLIKNKKLEIAPLMCMRGRTFKNSVIIADEMQNSSVNQMKMLLTRIGDNSKIILTGDLYQKEKPNSEDGLSHFLKIIEKEQKNGLSKDWCSVIKFKESDVERSELVRKVVSLYSKYDTDNTLGEVSFTPRKIWELRNP